MAKLFDQDEFARRIRVRIAELGIDQAQCARETGLSKATISRICYRRKSPDVETYLRLVQWASQRDNVTLYAPPSSKKEDGDE